MKPVSYLFKRITAVVCLFALCCALKASGVVYLSFDDGPNNGNSGALVNALKNAGARATFFCIGKNITSNMTGFNAYKNAGYSIQNHSYSHQHMLSWTYSQVYNDILKCQQAVQAAGGGTPRYFRPPYLEVNTTIRSACAALGLTIVNTTVDSQDWNGANTATIIANCNKLQAGGTPLMHDWPPNTVTAIPTIVHNLASRGLGTAQY
jgi:peptidoglycan/xylan/chitin deacetylase (PgdA/CDA1 family)